MQKTAALGGLLLLLLLLVPAPGHADETGDLAMLEAWASHYLSPAEMQEPVYLRTARAMIRMYRAATTLADGAVPMIEQIVADPFTPIWRECGPSALLYRDVLAHYGYTVAIVQLWHRARPEYFGGHVVVEVGGPGLADPVYYDPMYGYFLESSGERISLATAVIALDDPTHPDVQPVHVEPYEDAADPTYQLFNTVWGASYEPLIYGVYFGAVVWNPYPSRDWLVLIRDPAAVDPDWVLATYAVGGRQITFYTRTP